MIWTVYVDRQKKILAKFVNQQKVLHIENGA